MSIVETVCNIIITIVRKAHYENKIREYYHHNEALHNTT